MSLDPALTPILFSPWLLGVLGLCIGSFLNVVIHRLPKMMERAWRLESAELLGVEPPADEGPLNLSRPASRCPHCGHAITWRENIPVLSWLMLRGRCAGCKAPISKRYPAFELLTGALFAAAAWRWGPQASTLLWCGFFAVLVAATGIDWDTTLLPDQLTLPLLWAGIVGAALGWTGVPLSTAVWGAVAGYLALWSVYWVFKLVTGKEGMGYGDFKLLAALGAWLGAPMLLPVILVSSIIGAIVGIAMKFRSELREGRYVPFGPFLAGAGIVVALAGPERVLNWMGWGA